jgi:hypothetical protein
MLSININMGRDGAQTFQNLHEKQAVVIEQQEQIEQAENDQTPMTPHS